MPLEPPPVAQNLELRDEDTKGIEVSRDFVTARGSLCDGEEAEDVPPDGGYGWVCVACVHVMSGNAWGSLSVS